ncbi:hypothetical protein PGTUg99_014175 [Puccinia graminis f. sp. tritici]|uniref:Tet-like 2OG-Fe(II) oxygenase domain-containing protein n=1 Tax=Puccinia graminis f. sp. tritici TaxID=56615 RepID=A0A5B0RWH0_PUCGR|nr:hypothetical protein PGTUg99_014175 [Puccinia graminis f. sp. tritici]
MKNPNGPMDSSNQPNFKSNRRSLSPTPILAYAAVVSASSQKASSKFACSPVRSIEKSPAKVTETRAPISAGAIDNGSAAKPTFAAVLAASPQVARSKEKQSVSRRQVAPPTALTLSHSLTGRSGTPENTSAVQHRLTWGLSGSSSLPKVPDIAGPPTNDSAIHHSASIALKTIQGGTELAVRRSFRIAAIVAKKMQPLTPTNDSQPDVEECDAASSELTSLSSLDEDLTSIDEITKKTTKTQSNRSSSLSSLSCGNTDSENPTSMVSKKTKKRRRKEAANLTPHQRQKRNKNKSSRRRAKRLKDSLDFFTSAAPPPGAQIITRKMKPIDLFPAISEEFRDKLIEYKHQLAEHKKDPRNLKKPPTIYPRNPTMAENTSALEIVQKSFHIINSNYNKIYDKRTNRLIALVEFIDVSDLSSTQRNDLDFLCLFLHQCKEFISPVASKSRKCGGIMWAVGWRKGYKELEILGRYRDQAAIDKNPNGFKNLMSGSNRAGKILWNTFHSFGDVAVEKNQAYMKRFNIPSIADNNFPENPNDKSPFGFASNLAFSSNGFYNHHHTDNGDLSDLPLAFALIIPTSKITGRIATKAEGYDVKNGHFIFRDMQLALNFKPDTICRMIFRAQEYVHGTLCPTEPSYFTKSGMALQVATRTSNACKNYINGDYDDDSDKYFCGVEELLNN